MSDMLKARSSKLSPDVTGKNSYRGPYTYSFTKKEEFFEHQEKKGAVADLSQTNMGILWHLKMHRGCFGMDYFGSSGFCGMFQIVFLSGRGPETGMEDLSTNEVSNSPPPKD